MNKKENQAKIYRVITYVILIFLAVISIVPFYNMIIGCTHDNAAYPLLFRYCRALIWQIITAVYRIM